MGCQSNKPQRQNDQPSSKNPSYSVESPNLANEGQAIVLARDLIKQDDVPSAIEILKPFKIDQLALNEQQLYVLARAELAVARNDIQEALFWISGQYSVLFDNASKTRQMTLLYLRSDVAAMQQDYLSAARERIFIGAELFADEKQRNHDVIWDNLLKLTLSELERFLEDTNGRGAYATLDLVGWVQLAHQIQNVQGQVYIQKNKLQAWLAANAEHPAAQMLPSPLLLIKQVLQNQPNQIAVLVPFTGKYGLVGRSIQAGLLSEYYNVASYQSTSLNNQGAPLNSQLAPLLKFYDTGVDQLDIVALYQQAVKEGAEFVIGPFFEKPVNELANYAELTVPVLLLRSTQDPPKVAENTLQFDLSLNQEVRLLAKRAYADGHRNAAIINTKNSKGRQKFADIFEQTFVALGGIIVAKTQLDTSIQKGTGRAIKYIVPVKELMGIDASEQRARALYGVIEQPVSNFEVRPRRDIDMVFMAVSQKESVRLKPIFNQQYASEIPFYSLSEIYSGGQLPKQYDFDNMRLQVMPWQLQGVTHSHLPQRDDISNSYKANEAIISIVAQGVDAYNIMLQFEIFKQFAGNTISGVTGRLYQASDGVIQTKRDWVMINNNRITNYVPAQ